MVTSIPLGLHLPSHNLTPPLPTILQLPPKIVTQKGILYDFQSKLGHQTYGLHRILITNRSCSISLPSSTKWMVGTSNRLVIGWSRTTISPQGELLSVNRSVGQFTRKKTGVSTGLPESSTTPLLIWISMWLTILLRSSYSDLRFTAVGS